MPALAGGRADGTTDDSPRPASSVRMKGAVVTSHVTSADGTRIAFDRLGEGPPVVLDEAGDDGAG
jgi:hypothetical protein